MYKTKESIGSKFISRTVITNELNRKTIEIYHAETYTTDPGAAGMYRVKVNRAWYPDAESYWSVLDLGEFILKEIGIYNKNWKTETLPVEMPHDIVSAPVDIDEKYEEQIISAQQTVYDPDVVDHYFNTKYGINLSKKQTEREFFDALPFMERQAYMARALGHIPKKSGDTDELSNQEISESARVNSMSPDEQRKWILQQQKSAKDRLRTDKDARKKEKELKKENDNIDDLPDNWN